MSKCHYCMPSYGMTLLGRSKKTRTSNLVLPITTYMYTKFLLSSPCCSSSLLVSLPSSFFSFPLHSTPILSSLRLSSHFLSSALIYAVIWPPDRHPCFQTTLSVLRLYQQALISMLRFWCPCWSTRCRNPRKSDCLYHCTSNPIYCVKNIDSLIKKITSCTDITWTFSRRANRILRNKLLET